MKLLWTKPIPRAVLALLLVAAAMPAGLAVHGCRKEPPTIKDEPANLARWTAVNFRCPRNRQTYAKWVLSEDKHTARQEIDGDPSIIVSDRDLDRRGISGTWLVETKDDDDFVGFVFGYQNPGRFYLFDWKGRTQRDGAVGLAKQGMCLKLAAAAYDGHTSGNLKPTEP